MSLQKPNLGKTYCAGIMMLSHLTVSNEFINRIFGFAKLKKEVDTILAVSSYIAGRKKHTCIILLTDFTKAKNRQTCFNFNLFLDVKIPPFKFRRKEMLDAFKLLELLKKGNIKATFHIYTQFLYPNEKFDSLVSLPYEARIPQIRNVKIAGLRIEVKEAPGAQYSQIIDSYNNKTIFHSIILDERDLLITDNFLKEIFKKSLKYSRRLLKKKEE